MKAPEANTRSAFSVVAGWLEGWLEVERFYWQDAEANTVAVRRALAQLIRANHPLAEALYAAVACRYCIRRYSLGSTTQFRWGGVTDRIHAHANRDAWLDMYDTDGGHRIVTSRRSRKALVRVLAAAIRRMSPEDRFLMLSYDRRTRDETD